MRSTTIRPTTCGYINWICLLEWLKRKFVSIILFVSALADDKTAVRQKSQKDIRWEEVNNWCRKTRQSALRQSSRVIENHSTTHKDPSTEKVNKVVLKHSLTNFGFYYPGVKSLSQFSYLTIPLGPVGLVISERRLVLNYWLKEQRNSG